MNEQQISFLRTAGLPYDATEEQIAAFITALSDDQKNQLKALETPSAITDAIESATSGAAMSAKSNTTTVPAGSGASPNGAAQQPTAVATSAAPNTAAVALAAEAPESISLAAVNEMNELAQLSGLGSDWALQMVREKKSPTEARQLALAAKAKKREPVPMSGGFEVGEDRQLVALGSAVRDAILLRSGQTQIPEYDPQTRDVVMLSADNGDRKVKTRKPHDLAQSFRYLPMIEMGRKFLMALGLKKAEHMAPLALAGVLLNRNRFRDLCAMEGVDYVALSMATGDFTQILGENVNKNLRQAYMTQQPTWPLWCRKGTVNDFKLNRELQLSEFPTLKSMVEGEEYEYGTFSESGETYRIGKYGKGVQFTREMLINDDLNAFSRTPMLMGRAAARLEETTAIGVLTANAALSDGNNLFSTAHANLTTGVLSVTSLAAAETAMRTQIPLGGTAAQPMDTQPAILLVPTSKGVLAKQLISSTVDPAKNNATPNPYQNTLTVLASALLEANSAVQWYLLADPNNLDTVLMAFLQGEEGPTIEEEVEFDNDSVKMKTRHHVVAKALDHRGMVRSSGA